ncbi:1835_t:CDS:2, partial [Acaulospora colombiana]
INPKFKRLRYRYVYGIGVSERASNHTGEIWDTLIKSDLEAKEVIAMWTEEHCYPSEPVFVAYPGRESDEDDGILLSVIFDGENLKSFLVVIDAKTMKELARADLPHVVPISFGHGEFKELKKE